MSRYRQCAASGTNPLTVVRLTPMKIWYSLSATSYWRCFPQLNDKFYLKKTQRVKILYKIVTWFHATSQFLTRLIIDNSVQDQFNQATTNTLERTHEHEDMVWLYRGWPEFRVEYIATHGTSNRPPNGHSLYHYSALKIEFL